MADIDITVSNKDAFARELENAFQWCMGEDAPISIMATKSFVNTILYEAHYTNTSSDPLNALRIADGIVPIFSHSLDLAYRLMCAGKMVKAQPLEGYSHIIQIRAGTFAVTGKPSYYSYKVLMDDHDAMLEAVRWGGRLV